MSTAMKCDRCGKHYPQRVPGARRGYECFDDGERRDLCNTCTESLWDWYFRRDTENKRLREENKKLRTEVDNFISLDLMQAIELAVEKFKLEQDFSEAKKDADADIARALAEYGYVK